MAHRAYKVQLAQLALLDQRGLLARLEQQAPLAKLVPHLLLPGRPAPLGQLVLKGLPGPPEPKALMAQRDLRVSRASKVYKVR